MWSLEQSLTVTVLCPQLPITRKRHHRRRLHSLHGCTGSRTRLAPAASLAAESAAATRAGRPAGQRRLALPGILLASGGGRPAGQRSRTGVLRQQTRRDRGTDRSGRSDHRDPFFRGGRRIRRYRRDRDHSMSNKFGFFATKLAFRHTLFLKKIEP